MEKMPAFKAHLEDATLDGLPLDAQCRDDLRAIKKINGVPKIPKAKTQGGDGQRMQRHGDFAISLFLADYAMHTDIAAVCTGFESVSRRQASGSDDFGNLSRRMF